MDDCGTGDYSAPSADYSSAPDTSTHFSSVPDTSTHFSSAPDTSTHFSSAPDTSTHCSSAPDTSKHCSSSVDPPPDYSTCVSHPKTGNSNHHSGTTDTTQHSHHWRPISGDGASEARFASSAPFFDVTSESNLYSSQPSYNPSYMADRSTTPSPNVHGRKTIVLKRTDAQNSARNRKLAIGLCLGLIIGAIIPICVFILMAR